MAFTALAIPSMTSGNTAWNMPYSALRNCLPPSRKAETPGPVRLKKFFSMFLKSLMKLSTPAFGSVLRALKRSEKAFSTPFIISLNRLGLKMSLKATSICFTPGNSLTNMRPTRRPLKKTSRIERRSARIARRNSIERMIPTLNPDAKASKKLLNLDPPPDGKTLSMDLASFCIASSWVMTFFSAFADSLWNSL